MKFKQLILITGVERSGSTLISRVLQMCEANAGRANKMRENISLRALSSATVTIPLLRMIYNKAKETETQKYFLFRELYLTLGRVVILLAAIVINNFKLLFILTFITALFYITPTLKKS